MENIIEANYYEAVKRLNESILSNKAEWYDYISRLPIKQQIVYTVILFHSQVENGGFHQYFLNSYGQFVFLTLINLKIIGADKRHTLLQTALNKVNDEKADEDTFRELVFKRELKKISGFDQELMDYLNGLDNEYYNMADEDITDLLEKYLVS